LPTMCRARLFMRDTEVVMLRRLRSLRDQVNALATMIGLFILFLPHALNPLARVESRGDILWVSEMCFLIQINNCKQILAYAHRVLFLSARFDVLWRNTVEEPSL